MTMKQDIVAILVREYGMKTAHAVLCAIEVASARWTDEDTVTYGTKARDNLRTIQGA